MSAYICSDKAINSLAINILCFEIGNPVRTGNPLINPTLVGERQLAANLYAMNARAVNQRYNDDNTEDYGDSFRSASLYPNDVYFYKQLANFLYQCSEGSVPNEPLYKVLEMVCHRLADEIVSKLHEYKEAPWGEKDY